MSPTPNPTMSSPPPPQPQPHPRPLSHISLPITNHAASRAFYTAILAPLGLHLVYDSEDPPPPPNTFPGNRIKTLGYGPTPQSEILNLFEYPAQQGGRNEEGGMPGFHVAFNAPTREAVVEFHRRAMEMGGRSRGKPGVRGAYGRGYFAAWVVDGDGWRVEAVCKGEVAVDGKGGVEEGAQGEGGVGEKGETS